MAQNYLLFTQEKFNNYILPQEITNTWGLPSIDEEGSPINYTIKKAFSSANFGTSPPLPISISPSGYTQVSAENATHFLCGINNLTVNQDRLLSNYTSGEGVDYSYVKLTVPQVIHLRDTGEIID